MTGHLEVAGAGFAGLTVATALARRGFSARVHEESHELRAYGAGIFLWENGLDVLRAIGCHEDVIARSHEADRWEERDHENGLNDSYPLPWQPGARMITLLRQDLYAPLLASARAAGVEILTGSRVVAADAAGYLVTADGRTWAGDVVVGADGIRSPVRESLGLITDHVVFPFGIFRLVVPLDRAPGTEGQWANYVNFWNVEKKRRVLYVPCNRSDLYLLLGALDDDEEALSTPISSEVWCASFPALTSVLRDLPQSPRFDRYESITLQSWTRGRAAVVGDAAHAMPPTIGQGAGTAMANAFALAVAIAGSTTVEEALQDWEREARSNTDLAQRTSVDLVEQVVLQAGVRSSDAVNDVRGDAVQIATRRTSSDGHDGSTS